MRPLLLFLAVLFTTILRTADTGSDPRIGGPPVPGPLANPWPEDWETAFRARALRTVRMLATNRLGGTTYGESEKDLYPRAMAHVLGSGDRARALKSLQEEDNQARVDHAHTQGIDLYWCFTLKGQMRKYFLFGEDLEPAYRERMRLAFAAWTSADPLGRPHPVHGRGSGAAVGWGPDVKGGWVDARDTDNLRAMREIGILLAAEESGNMPARDAALARLRAYVVTLYRTGMREWDSSNYHSHALSSWHNLHDFARDTEARALAKAALDWLYAAGAYKYRAGTVAGPKLRDYGSSTVPFGGNSIHSLELYFGMAPVPDPRPDRDDVHHVTSGYRPPRAIVELARKSFPVPVEMISSKPAYRLWKEGEAQEPRYREFQYFGAGFQLGSLVSEGPESAWNPSVFSLVVDDPERGAVHVGWTVAPPWEHQVKRPGDQLGQHRNRLVWMRPAATNAPFHLQIPADATWDRAQTPWVIRLPRATLHVWPVGLGEPAVVTPPDKARDLFARDRVWRFTPSGTGHAGFAVEVLAAGDPPKPATFQVLDATTWQLTGADGHSLRIGWNPSNDLPRLVRDGVTWDWNTHRAPYAAVSGTAPIRQDWLGGRLTVEAGGWRFESEVTPTGTARFRETRP